MAGYSSAWNSDRRCNLSAVLPWDCGDKERCRRSVRLLDPEKRGPGRSELLYRLGPAYGQVPQKRDIYVHSGLPVVKRGRGCVAAGPREAGITVPEPVCNHRKHRAGKQVLSALGVQGRYGKVHPILEKHPYTVELLGLLDNTWTL